MKTTLVFRRAARRLQRGAAALEFALVAALFLMALLVGIIELGRAFFYMNATAEATRLGARIAVVCDKGTSGGVVRARMRELVNVLPDESIEIAYSPANCSANTAPLCQSVTVRIVPGAATFPTFIPFVPLTWTIPSFSTTLPRESLDSAGGSNPVCN